MLGITDYFNISAYLQEPIGLLTSQKDTLVLDDHITDAQAPLSGVATFNISIGDELNGIVDDLTTELEQLPPADFDRDNASQALLFESKYLSDQLFQWSDASKGNPLYTDSLENVNDILIEMDSVTNFVNLSPFTFLDGRLPLNFTAGKDVLNSTAFCAGSDFEDSGNTGTTDAGNYPIYTFGGQDELLCSAVTTFEQMTTVVNALDNNNTQFVTDLESTLEALSGINSSLTSLDAYGETILNSTHHVNDSLSRILPLLNGLRDQVDELVGFIENINSNTLTANEHSRCGFIGNMYHDVALGAICNDFHNDLLSTAGPVIATGCLMFVSFLIIGWYGYSIRRHTIHPSHPSAEKDDHFFLKENGAYQSILQVTPPASPRAPTAPLCPSIKQ